jgi:hypothetical protein
MYARVTTYEGGVEDYDQGLDKLRSDIVPQLHDVPGYKGILTMLDRSTGESLSITLWDDEDTLTRSQKDANRIRSQAADTTGSTVTDVTEYEVGVAELF